jgi:hypothetical protein
VSEQLKAPLGFPKGATVVPSAVVHLVPLGRSDASLHHLTLVRLQHGECLLDQLTLLPVHPLVKRNSDDVDITRHRAVTGGLDSVGDDVDLDSLLHLIAPSFRASSAHLDAVFTHAIRIPNPMANPTQMKKSDMTLPF